MTAKTWVWMCICIFTLLLQFAFILIVLHRSYRYKDTIDPIDDRIKEMNKEKINIE